MVTYRKAFEVLKDAIENPDDEKKLREAKRHPRLKRTLAGFTMEDLKVLKRVADASGKRFKCDQS
jgi:hypothetical protein